MIHKLKIRTSSPQEFKDITFLVEEVVRKEGVKEGVVTIFVPHTTAAVTINENYDPSVVEDILRYLEKIIPTQGDYTHLEGNAHAHIKASIIGSSRQVLVEESRLNLGTWQGIFFCEFDGPRVREVWITIR